MNGDTPLLDRALIEDAFRRLGDRLAARRRDAGDIGTLVRHLNLRTPAEVMELCAEVFPEEPVPARAHLVVEEIFEGGVAGG